MPLIGLFAAIVLIVFVWNSRHVHQPVFNFSSKYSYGENDHNTGRTCTITDESGTLISKISRRTTPGDQLITSEGKHYRVERVDRDWATAELLGTDSEYLAYREYFSGIAVPALSGTGNNTVAIYHTHTDESYLPSDGRASIPFNGSIIQVGSTYKNTLVLEGARVLHDVTRHEPHDNNAYYRSRRTAFQLMKRKPLALFDVHRDGVDDPEFYRKYIANRNVAQIRIVVGRQNPHWAANLDFARKVMAYANRVNPTIVKEIFMGRGNYNQDLMPTALLLEAGTYTNRKEEAMEGVELLASAVPIVLGINGLNENPPAGPGGDQPETWRALAWITVLTLLGGAAFIIINAGSLSGAKRQIYCYYKDNWEDTLKPFLNKIPVEKWYGAAKSQRLATLKTVESIKHHFHPAWTGVVRMAGRVERFARCILKGK